MRKSFFFYILLEIFLEILLIFKLLFAKMRKKLILIIIVLSAVIMGLLLYPKANENFKILDDNTIRYSNNRPSIKHSILHTDEVEGIKRHKVVFDSKGTKIYSYLYIPKEPKLAVILLAGGNVGKEREEKTSLEFARMGCAVITLDQRGVGETSGYFPSIQQDYEAFIKGEEPNSYLMVYDVIRAYDLLEIIEETKDIEKIVAGESMGGRIAIIVGSMEPGIKGIIGISTAGFGEIILQDEREQKFFTSINPDNYISKISPRKVVMIHYRNDTTVPFKNSYFTYEKAGLPKDFYPIDNCTVSHGFCKEMLPYLKKEIESFIDQKTY